MFDYDTRHGGPFDCGMTDAFYRRSRKPHYFEGASYASKLIDENAMTDEEIEAYNAGYNFTVDERNFFELLLRSLKCQQICLPFTEKQLKMLLKRQNVRVFFG